MITDMDFAPAYLVHRFFYRIGDFFHHWYVDGSRVVAHKFMEMLESADQTIAFRVTLLHFFEPLYKDYSVIGRILGVIFRSGRLLLGGVFYALVIIVFAAVYLLWLGIPAVAIFYVITG